MISVDLKDLILKRNISKKLAKNNSYLEVFNYLSDIVKEVIMLFLNEHNLKESESLQLLVELL